jgi:hypothetical protein
MSTQPRFNLSAIRYLCRPRAVSEQAQSNSPRISRRDFLGLSAAAGAAVAIPPFLYGDGFAVAYDGSKIVVSVHGEPRWTIDAAKFGSLAKVGIQRVDGRLRLSLIDGFFPGTEIPANFEAVLAQRAGDWTMEMVMGCGIRVEAELLPWLNSQVPAQGKWSASSVAPCDGFNLSFHTSPRVQLTRDWVFAVDGAATARVDGLAQQLDTDLLRISLNPDGQIANDVLTDKSLFQLQRGSRSWRIDLQRTSEQGWALTHDEHQELFDELVVETGKVDRRAVHSALLLQGEGNATSTRFITGGGLVSDSGDQFHLSLHNPRIAFALNESPVRSAFVAELSTHPSWAHGEYASYYIAGAGADPKFELIDDGDQSPPPDLPLGLCQICFPDDAVAMNLKFDEPKPFRVTWADIAAPFERLWGKLHLLPSQHAFEIYFDDNPTPDHVLHIDRPQDLLSLRFQFKNMRLITGCHPRIVLRDKNTPGQISVIFPPQHVAEEAFFHTDDSKFKVDVSIASQEVIDRDWAKNPPTVTDCELASAKQKLDPDYVAPSPAGCPPNPNAPPPVGTGNKDAVTPRTLLSGDSRLVFSIPKGKTEIPFHLENLLQWKDWTPVVADVAQNRVDTSDYDKIPKIAEPKDVTAIELPYKVVLSPSELGRWVHSVLPAKNDTNIVELWHTRLAVATQASTASAALQADESNSKDRTVRAIWSSDYVGVERTNTVDPNMPPRSYQHPDALGFPLHYTKDSDPATYDDPFRMTLDSLDRCELVHLTSNYRIPKPAYVKELKPTGDKILPPSPVNVERMMLTSVGGYLKSLGVWSPAKIDVNHQLTVEQWRHIATLGRDHYVRVVYKGYLLPFGHRVSLVKVTERKIVINPDYPKNGFVAILHQRMFIVAQNPVKDFPVLGQPYGGRQIPFRRVEVQTLITPDLDAPGGAFPGNPNRTQTQSLFWPTVGGQPFPFRFRFTDMAGNVSEASFRVVFADAAVSQNSRNSSNINPTVLGPKDAIDLFNAGTGKAGLKDDPWTTASFSDQKVAFAAPTKPGDTQYDAEILAFGAIPPPKALDVLDLYKNDLPYFYPSLSYARISSSSIKRITAKSDSTRVVFFQSYLDGGFDPKQNRGEVILQVHDEKPLPLAFGTNGNVDKAGGLANPDIQVAGFSRKSGPVGGKAPVVPAGTPAPSNPAPTPSLSTYSSGNFNPGDFFGGLTSAKILGGIKLSDIIAPLAPGLASNLEKAPQMLEQAVFEIEKIIGGIVDAINALQTPALPLPNGSSIPNPLATHLAPQAQQVFALNNARIQAHNRTSNDQQGSLAKLADTVAEGDVDRQLVGAIKDYATTLASLLSNPVALAEETLVKVLTDFLLEQINAAGLSLEAQFSNVITALLTDLQASAPGVAQTALGAATTVLETLEKAALIANEAEDEKERAKRQLSDTLRIARDSLKDKAKDAAVLAFSQYAPDLVAVCNVIDKAEDLQQRVSKLTKNVSLTAIPGFFEQLNGILDDLLQIYQSAGFLGIVAANPSVVDEIKAAEGDIAKIWREQVSYVTSLINDATATVTKIKGDIQGLEDTCLKLAAKVKREQADVAKKILQNLRQVQAAVDSIDSYKKQLQQLASLGPEAVLRLNQLLQQFQRQILASLAALQDLIDDTTADLASAATAAGVDIVAFEGQLTGLAQDLTAAGALIGTGGQPGPLEKRVDQSLAKPAPAAGAPVVGDLLSGPLGESNAAIKKQLLDIRNKPPAELKKLKLQLLHYDLCLQMQQSFAAGLEWSIFRALATVPAAIQTALADLNKLNDFATAIASRISSALANVLCPLKTFWQNFLQLLKNGAEPEPTIYRLFQASLDGISTALTTLCSDAALPVPRPSVLIADARNVFAAFKSLVDDVHLRISSLAGLPQAALDIAISFATQKLNELIQEIEKLVPTSITLSYDWHPKIQPFEPVFLLDEGADFVVSAKATLSVPLPGAAPPSVDITASLTKFSINLIGSPSFVIVKIDSLTFTSHNGSSPDCRVSIKTVEFGKDMSFVKSLAEALNPSKGPFIELADGAIKAGFRFAVESLPSAGMTVMGLAIEVAVALPFNGDPVRCEFGISDQQHPFLLSFGIYGGGGFLQLQLGLDGVQLLQGALEFGLVSSISIGPLRGEGFIVGGIYFRIAKNDAKICGFVHAHGHMDIFGLISLDVDLYVGVCYLNGVVTGTATFSVHVSILFFSEDFSLQASYTFGGSNGSNSDVMLEPYMNPRFERGELANAAFLVSPDDSDPIPQGTSKADPVFISKDDWIAYLNAFDLEPQGA